MVAGDDRRCSADGSCSGDGNCGGNETDKMCGLEDIRRQIDEIDDKLLELFCRRMDAVKGVAAFKIKNGMPVFRPEREKMILEHVESDAGADMGAYARDFFSNVMRISREMQQKIIEEENPLGIIKAEDLDFEYEASEEGVEPIRALKNVNLDIEEGTFTAILGMNGSGKSTLAKNMNALFVPTSGKMFVGGMDTSDDELVWDIRKISGMVFQNPDNQIVSAIVEDDVAFGPENTGVPPDEIRRRIDGAMKAAGIYEQRLKSSTQLSGGQKQRVAIAGVLAMGPRCIVFDEPTAMLDPEGRQEVMNIIKTLGSRNITVVLITHFMEEAAEADRVVVMNDGNIVADGRPSEVFMQEDLIRDAGLDVPPAVRMAEMLRKNGIDVPDDVLDIGGLADFIAAAAQEIPKAAGGALNES